MGLYEFFFAEHSDAQSYFRAAVERNLPASGCILDLGCGDNHFLAPYRTEDRQVWGADFQQHVNLLEPAWFRLLGPEGRIPFPDGSFDLVTTSWVLEHIGAPEEFFREVSRVLRPGGLFISLSINAEHYVTWLIRLVHVLPHAWIQRLVYLLYGRPEHDTFPTCYRANTMRQLCRLAKSAQLEIEAISQIPNQDYFSFFRPLHMLAVAIDGLLDRWSQRFARLYFIATMKKEPSLSAQTTMQSISWKMTA